MKVKNKIMHEVEIYLNRDLSVKKISRRSFNVLAQNEKNLVIDDHRFSTISLKKEKGYQMYQYVGQIRVSDYTKDSHFCKVWGDFVVRCYHYDTSTKILQNRINKAVDSFIHEKIGAYLYAGKCNIKLTTGE